MTRLVLLASYPKSGNTWLRLMLDSVQRGGAAVDINAAPFISAAARSAADRLAGLETADLPPAEIARLRPRLWSRAAREAAGPVLLKVHDALLPTPLGPSPFEIEDIGAAIYLVRDPRDVAVSLAHHFGWGLDQAIDVMGQKDFWLSDEPDRLQANLPQFLSSWSAHAGSWLDGHANVLPLRYEDMLATPEAAFAKALDLIGLQTPSESLARAIEATRFDTLRRQEARDGFAERLPVARGQFFRQGRSGGWRDSLSPDQVRRIESDHGEMMRRLGYLA